MEHDWNKVTVPIIHNDLRQEETTVQIAVALDSLDVAMSSVFKHVNSLIIDYKTRLAKLQKRSLIVKGKVEKLSGTDRATKVFSCTKYPASDVPKDYEYTFQLSSSLKDDNRDCQIKIKAPIISHPLKDKSKFFYIKRDNNRMMVRKNIELASNEGLGALPDDLEYISSLLLFNTTENLYKDYVLSDPLHVFNKSRSVLDRDEKNEIEAAPMTMSTSDQAKYKGLPFYSPVLQDVPEIDVPLDLPDLPGIAGDLRYNLGIDPVIAPSLVATPLGELPSFITSPADEAAPSEIQSVPPPPMPPAPPPPPTPPQMPPEMPAPPPPPPPPPMPPLLEATPPSTSNSLDVSAPEKNTLSSPLASEMVSNNPSSAGSGDARANLMEAIRNAGGKAKLKSVTDRKQEAKRIKEVESSMSHGGNLMADLHAKLAMRRKGISGQRGENVGETPIERMLLNANPPAKLSETEDDADWDE